MKETFFETLSIVSLMIVLFTAGMIFADHRRLAGDMNEDGRLTLVDVSILAGVIGNLF